MSNHIRIGLRFHGRDYFRLLELAQDSERREDPEPAQLHRNAADAARTGEPLILECEHPREAHIIAAIYETRGITRPALDTLNPSLPVN